MGYPKIAHLVEALYQKTIAGDLNWEITDKEEVFQISIPDYSIRLGVERDDDGDNLFTVYIYNSEGKLIEKTNPVDLCDYLDNPYREMSDLYNIARRRALGVEKALDDILSGLGYIETEEKDITNNPDDLPF